MASCLVCERQGADPPNEGTIHDVSEYNPYGPLRAVAEGKPICLEHWTMLLCEVLDYGMKWLVVREGQT